MGWSTQPLASGAEDQCLTPGDIYDDEMDIIARDVYARDYVMYGFENRG